jgi:hypothetical protein
MTFLCGQQGRIYQRDIGPRARTTERRIESFNPGSDWAALADLNDGRVNSQIILAFVQNPEGDMTGECASFFAAGLIAASCKGQEASALSQAKTAVSKLAKVRALHIG